MKRIGYLLILVGTVAGVTVATTACSPRLQDDVSAPVGLTLNDPAGVLLHHFTSTIFRLPVSPATSSR